MKKLIWLFNRLKSMSINEIVHRVINYKVNKVNKIKYNKKLEVKDMLTHNISLDKIDEKLKKIYRCSENGMNISEISDYYSFGNKINILDKINWHEGTISSWNKDKYSLDIDTKYSDEIGDIRYTWEINRHQFFPYLALLYKTTGDKKYYNILKEHFYDWSKENYFLKGVNWLSPMEIAIRSYQWLITYHILEGIAEDSLRTDIIKSIITSIEYTTKNLSKFSSANNHLILEAVIISIVGYICEDSYRQDWFEIGYSILKDEIKVQNYNDGVNKEQALHYQAFVIDALLQYNFILKKINRIPIEEEIIKKSLVYMGSLKSDKLNFDYGDSDDAKIITFSCGKFNYYKYILELGSVYYEIKFIEFDYISPEVKFISGIDEVKDLDLYEYPKSKLYDEGGYLVINSNNNVILMDVGELGYGAIAAHGHADALSVIYYNNNNPIIIDSGTYIYNVETKLRNYFRSTEAHSTLCYKGTNQSEIKGPFLWGNKAKVNVLNYCENNDKISIKANHNGYKPLIHTRELEYFKNDNRLVIRDYFEDEAKINYILDNNSEVTIISPKVIKIKSNNSILSFECNADMYIEDTIISREFMHKIKSKKLVIKNNALRDKYIELIIRVQE